MPDVRDEQKLRPVQAPASVSPEFLRALHNLYAYNSSDMELWAALGITHSSFLHEKNRQETLLTPDLLGVLEVAGSSFLQLAAFQMAFERHSLPNQARYVEFANALMEEELRLLWGRLDLQRAAFLGAGERSAGQLGRAVVQAIPKQLIGAIGLADGYALIVSSLRDRWRSFSPGRRDDDTSSTADYKSLLQERLGRLRWPHPRYRILSEVGPEHQKSFQAQVSSGQRSATGIGPTKKFAERSAALAFIKRYFLVSSSQTSLPPRPASFNVTVHSDHLVEVNRLAGDLGFPFSAKPLLSQALIHRSYSHESRDAALPQPNDNLAQLGAFAFVAIAWYLTARALLEGRLQDFSVGEVAKQIAHVRRSEKISTLFHKLDVQNAILVGKGAGSSGLATSMKSDFVEAILGAWILGNRGMLNLDRAPQPIVEWIADQLITLIPEEHRDPKSSLQEYGALIVFRPAYRSTSRGLAHALTYTSTVYGISESKQSQIALGIGTGQNRKAAEHDAASRAVEAIHFLNHAKRTAKVAAKLTSSDRFLLRNMLERLPKDESGVIGWLSRGMLASRSLSNGHISEFCLWAEWLQGALKEESDAADLFDRLIDFYRILRTVSGRPGRTAYGEALAEVGSLVRCLDPDGPTFDVRGDHRFLVLLELCKLANLLSKPFCETSLNESLDGFELLRVRKGPMVVIDKPPRDLVFIEREGRLQTLLESLFEFVPRIATGVSLSCMTDTSRHFLKLRVSSENAIFDTDAIDSDVRDGLLWKFLKADIPIMNCKVSASSIEVGCYVVHPLSIEAFAERAVRVFHSAVVLSSAHQDSRMAGLLHSLKNQLIAFEQALGHLGHGRTTDLRVRLDASRHLDSALELLASLETVGDALAEPQIEPFDPSAFFPTYVAEKVSTLPKSIRVLPPRTTQSAIVFTSKDFMRVVLDNLVKNSAEAMTNGGDITIDWVFDGRDQALLIEVEDNGPGMDAALLSKLLAGEAVTSTKQRGSGLGMMTVKALLARLCGKLTGASTISQGTRWLITLPSIKPDSEGNPGREVELNSYEASS